MSSHTLLDFEPDGALSDRVRTLLRARGLMRARDFRAEGVTPATLSRMVASGDVLRLGRGLYQLADADVDPQHALGLAAKRAPNGVVCLASALAFHDLTDQHPRRVWMAIGLKAWTPRPDIPPLEIVRMSPDLLASDIEHHAIDGVAVPIFSVARSIVDAFRLERRTGRNLAIEALREALRRRLVSPAQIAETAARVGAWPRVRPYLEALTADA